MDSEFQELAELLTCLSQVQLKRVGTPSGGPLIAKEDSQLKAAIRYSLS